MEQKGSLRHIFLCKIASGESREKVDCILLASATLHKCRHINQVPLVLVM